MELLKVAAEIFMKQLGSQGSDLNLVTVIQGLRDLLPTKGEELDIASLVAKFTSNGEGLASIAASWLGNGGNESINVSSIISVLGSPEVAAFAQTLGLGKETAAEGLSEMIPQLIDQASSGGSLMQDLGSKLLSGNLSSFF